MFFGFAKEGMGRQFSICTRVPHLNLPTPCRFKIWIKIIYFIDYHTWGKMPLCEKGLQTLPRDFVNKGASIETCTSSCCETNPFGPERGQKYTDEFWPSLQAPSPASWGILRHLASELWVFGKCKKAKGKGHILNPEPNDQAKPLLSLIKNRRDSFSSQSTY